MYWQIGKRIPQDVLQEERAGYGMEIVQTLSAQLTAEYGQEFGRRNLFQMVRFAEVFSNREMIASLSQQLSGSHFVEPIPLEDSLKRDFYAEICRVERWSVRTLRDKIGHLDLLFSDRRPSADGALLDVLARLAWNSFCSSQRANSRPGSVAGLPTSLNWKPASLVETSLATSEPPPVRSRVKMFPSTEYKPLKDCVGWSLGVKLHVKVFSLSNVSKKAEPSSRVAFQLPWKTVGLMLMGGVLGDGCSGGVSTVGGSGVGCAAGCAVGCAMDDAANSDGVVFSGGAIICSRSIAT